MDLKLNDSEIMVIMNLMEEELYQKELLPMMEITIKSFLKKVNDNIQYKHHNEIDDFGCLINQAYFAEEN